MTDKFQTFKIITDFVSALCDELDDKLLPVKFYSHLLSRTTFSKEHEEVIDKHVNLFKDFCIQNREAIYGQQASLIVKPRVEYSPKVFIDIHDVFGNIDKDSHVIVWEHLLMISAHVDLQGRAKDILRSMIQNTQGKSADADDGKSDIQGMFGDLVSKIEDNITPDVADNPMGVINNIMTSGVFTELIGDMTKKFESGELNVEKLSQGVQTMANNATSNLKESDQGNQMGEMIGNIMQNLGPMMQNLNTNANNNVTDHGVGNQQMPDLSNMLGPMMSMMQSGNKSDDELSMKSAKEIEANIDMQLKAIEEQGVTNTDIDKLE